MAEEYKVYLPKLGESITSATVVQWFKEVGDIIKVDDPLLEVSTDKVNSEIPSPVAGKLKAILANVGTNVNVGETLAIIEGEEEEKSFYSPAVLMLAQEKGLSKQDLKNIPRKGDRLSKKELEVFLASKETTSSNKVVVSPIRRAIAENVTKAYREIPHASLVFEIDVTDILAFIEQERERFLQKWGVKLTITTFIAESISKALILFPLVNARWQEGEIFLNQSINLGIAVRVVDGVVVPIIKNMQDLKVPEIAKAIAFFADLARNGKLTLDDMNGGNITLTNFGMGGAILGFPIIRENEGAIIGVGAITKRVAWLTDGKIGMRSYLHLTLTFDHRLFDGIYGCSFLTEVKKHLENHDKSTF